mmetsp:Transcript_12484/g.31432  ORF Transcript_12484/g.31432 Transcript_12484/m.31432 type:complete len:595 (+) Transcript_12484:51-1835(+)
MIYNQWILDNITNIMNDTNYPLAPPGEEQRRSRCCPSGSGFRLSDRMIRAIFLLLGVGILIPWNAFVSATPYFASRLCQSGHDNMKFEQWFGLAWNLSSVISLGLIIVGQSLSVYWKKKKTEESLALNEEGGNDNNADPSHDSTNQSNNGSSEGSKDNSFFTVMVPLGLYMAVFSIQVILVTIPDISARNFLIVTLISLAMCGTCGAIATAGIVATAGAFPPQIGINPFFSGQALGGAAVAMANFAAIAIGEDPNDYLDQHCGSSMNRLDEPTVASRVSNVSIATTRRLESGASCSPYQNLDWAVLSYFLAGCIVLLLCLVGYHSVHQYEIERHTYETVDDQIGEQRETSSPYRDEEVEEDSPRIGLELNERIQQRQQLESIDDANDQNDIEQDEFLDEGEQNIRPDGPKSVIPVVKGPATTIVLTFAITLSLFPSWISELKSSHECENHYRLNNDLYVPFTFVFFNIGDLLGRLISGYIPVHRIRHMSRILVVSAMLRVLFLPLFLVCNSTLGSESNIVVRNDFFSLLIQLLFSVSNGILVSTSFMLSSQLAGSDSSLQERASEIMTFSISFGLLSGSFLAFPFLKFASHLLQ